MAGANVRAVAPELDRGQRAQWVRTKQSAGRPPLHLAHFWWRVGGKPDDRLCCLLLLGVTDTFVQGRVPSEKALDLVAFIELKTQLFEEAILVHALPPHRGVTKARRFGCKCATWYSEPQRRYRDGQFPL